MLIPLVDPALLDAVLGQQIGHRCHIGQLGQIAQHQRLVGQQAGRHQRQAGILGSTDRNLAFQHGTAANTNLVHLAS